MGKPGSRERDQVIERDCVWITRPRRSHLPVVVAAAATRVFVSIQTTRITPETDRHVALGTNVSMGTTESEPDLILRSYNRMEDFSCLSYNSFDQPHGSAGIREGGLLEWSFTLGTSRLYSHLWGYRRCRRGQDLHSHGGGAGIEQGAGSNGRGRRRVRVQQRELETGAAGQGL